MSTGADGTSLTTEFNDPALGAMRLAVTDDGAGLIRAVLTAGDPVSVALLQQAADRHHAAGELAGIDLRIRLEPDPDRGRDSRGEMSAGSDAGAKAFADDRRPDRDESAPPVIDPPIERAIRVRRGAGANHQPGSSRLGWTIDRIA